MSGRPSGRAKGFAQVVVITAAAGRRFVLFGFLALLAPLAACATRPETGFLSPVAEVAPGASVHTVLVATTRERDARPGTMFNGERSGSLDYAELTVSVPPTHAPNNVELASTPPGNPATDFVVRQADYLESDKQFLRALNAQLATRPRGDRKVFVFVHGINTMFAEGLYRLVQVVQDSKSNSIPVLFTWASRGKIRDYLYDNNSATAARDALEHTLRLLFASDADKINILAHSMGNWVTVEALRQIKISGHPLPSDKIGSIVLASPDIDLDVFKSQLRSFGTAHKPFTVVLSENDKALGLSKFIAGGESRVGDANVDELAALGATVVDLTNLKATDWTNHGKFDQLAIVAPELNSVLAHGIASNPAAQRQEAAGESLKSVVAMPITLLGAPIQIISAQ